MCQRYERRGYRAPPQADLPEFRLSLKPAFTFVGLDYAGPLYLKEPYCSAPKRSMSCCLPSVQQEPFTWNLLHICQPTCSFIVCKYSPLEGAYQKSLFRITQKHLRLQQRFYERCSRTQGSRDFLPIEELLEGLT